MAAHCNPAKNFYFSDADEQLTASRKISMARKPGSFLCQLVILAVFLRGTMQTTSPEKEETNADDFDEELYSVINSVRDGSLWTNSRRVRSIELSDNNTNGTNGNWSITDNSLWNDLWWECKRKPSFSCIRTGVFKYLDKSLERTNDVSLTDSLFFRKNNNKINGFCENSEEEKDNCLRYNIEKSKVMAGETSEGSPSDLKEVEINETISTGVCPQLQFFVLY
ncbi:hypothetical protein RUM43_013048 [Polyplax serrata]|uniref:Uncharacterized protein n=1 Tax=Polyplax serrata TaxID=468196 RepID=A0AAN8NJU5_POLSC